MDRKALSLPILISMVVGNMIGTGIYVLPASLAKYGTISIFSWIFTSIGALFIALTFTNLTRRFPKTGGPYVYCKEAFGQFGGFVAAYFYWLYNLVSIATIVVATTGYIGYLFPQLDSNSPEFSRYYVILAELAMVWAFTAINLIGIHTAGVVQLVLTVVKIIPLVLITLFGLFSVKFSNLTAHFSIPTAGTPLSALSSAAVITFWAFVGLESATIPAENTKGSSDIIKATLFGTIITSIIYIASTFVLMGMIPLNELQNSQFPFAQAGIALFGSGAALFVTLCAIASGLGTLNVCVLVQGQIVFAAARDHLFPRAFTKLSKHDVPVAGQLLSSFLVSLFIIASMQPTLLKQFDNIALLSVLLAVITYLGAMTAEMKFDYHARGKLLKVLTSHKMMTAILATIYVVWMICHFELRFLLLGMGILFACVPIYFFTVRKYV